MDSREVSLFRKHEEMDYNATQFQDEELALKMIAIFDKETESNERKGNGSPREHRQKLSIEDEAEKVLLTNENLMLEILHLKWDRILLDEGVQNRGAIQP